MKVLTDENISPVIVRQLNVLHDVFDIRKKGLSGISDSKVKEILIKEERILVTHDKLFAVNVSQDKALRVVLITFVETLAERNKMKEVGKFLSANITELVKENKSTHLRVDSSAINIYEL